MEDKDLDKLFQDKFEGIEAPPDPQVWDRIASSLDEKKKKKRVVPFWWLSAGAAAVLLLSLWLGGVFSSEPQGPALPEIVNEDLKEDPTPEDQRSITQEQEIQETTPLAEEQKQEDLPVNSAPKTRFDLPTSGQQIQNKRQGLAQQNSVSPKKSVKTDKERIEQVLQEKNSQVTRVEQSNNEKDTEKNAVDSGKTSDQSDRTSTAVVAENTAVTPTEENPKKDLFEVIKEQEAVAELEEGSSKKWSLNAAVAPVYYNTLGEGSPIHSNFATNSKSGEVNMSYGVNLAYSVTKKLKIRSGVHRVDLGYTTNDIAFSSSLSSSTSDMIENIDYGDNAVNLVVTSTARGGGNGALEELRSDIVADSPARNGQMRQQMRYLEIPVEMQYRFIDKKFSLDLIGGFSSLMLIDNQVSLSSEGRVTTMGEANNVNPFNFSTNLGVGLGYQLGEQWSLSVEPLFKYQLNTFDGEAGNFQPYSFGVYSGINFRF